MLDLNQTLHKELSKGTRIFFLDEAMFTFNTLSTKSWYSRHGRIEIDEQKLQMKSLALIAAASAEGGLEHYRIYHRSINTEQYIRFLEELSCLHPPGSTALFLDNMRVHRSKKAADAYKRLGI